MRCRGLCVPVFAVALRCKLVVACCAFVLALLEVILERGLVDIPVGADLATAHFALATQARDVLAHIAIFVGDVASREVANIVNMIRNECVVGGEKVGTDMTHSVYKYFVCSL